MSATLIMMMISRMCTYVQTHQTIHIKYELVFVYLNKPILKEERILGPS